MRARYISKFQIVSLAALPTVKADAATMLPCEFCEGLVPIEKLLEHQAQCVNPTNVRGGSALRNSASVSSFQMITEAAAAAAAGTSSSRGTFLNVGGMGATGTSLSRSHSMHNGRQARASSVLAQHEDSGAVSLEH